MNRTLALASLLLVACSSGSSGTPAASDDLGALSDGTTSVDTASADLSEIPDSAPEDGVTPDSTPDSAPDSTPGSDAKMVTDSSQEVTNDGTVDAVPAPDASDGPWPQNPDKDQIDDPGWDSTPAVGTIMPNFTALDQYGNEVELYDLAMDGRPIVLDVGTWFCEPCKSLAWYLATGETGECPYAETILGDLGWWNESYEIIKDLVDTGQIRWISILYSLGNPVTAQDAAAWHDAFPHDEIVVLADTSLQLQEYLTVEAMPRIDVLDEEMTFLVYHTGGPNKGMQKLVSLFTD